ncbi:hypothetical protein EDB84DRAFT_1442386 [Lactarius hengduanensis]|nr:hypothetical protein EDB84DRAFT_1442386 [Lactarius hengduanensis]
MAPESNTVRCSSQTCCEGRSPQKSCTKKARNVAGVKSLSKAAKSGNHVSTQPPVNTKVKTHPQGNSVIPRQYPVQIDVNAESDDNGGDEDSDQPESDEGEAMQPESEGEDVSGEDQDDLCNLGPKDLHAAFERERAKWGIDTDPLLSLQRAKWGIDTDIDNESDTNAVGDSHVNPFNRRLLKAGTAGDNDTLSDNENCDKDKTLTTFLVDGEVPKWDDPGDSDGTRKDTGTPFSSEGEDDNNLNAEQISVHNVPLRTGGLWPCSAQNPAAGLEGDYEGCHQRVKGDAIFDTAYHAVNSTIAYHRYTLYKSAKSLHHSVFTNHFFWDHEIGKAFSQVLCRVSKAQWPCFNLPWPTETDCHRVRLVSKILGSFKVPLFGTLIRPIKTSIKPNFGVNP